MGKIEELIEKYEHIIDINNETMSFAYSRAFLGENRTALKVIDDLKQLKSSLPTQQDKVVVKQYIADWYDNCQGRHANKRANAQEVIANMDLNGYTVEKEPLFIMPVPCMRNTLHYCLKDNGEISFRQGNAYKFNQDQIDKYFPEIKTMAVPAEEEAE